MKPDALRPRRAPSPPSTPIFGHARKFQRDPLGFLRATADTCGPVARLKLGPLTYHFVTEPALIAEVLQERASNYLRDTRSSRGIKLVTGESLLSTEGDVWRRQRRLAQPVFHARRIAALAGGMARTAAETAVTWDAAARAGTPLDLVSEMNRLTFTVVGRCLFGTDLSRQAGAVERAFPALLEELFFRAKHAFSLPLWLPLSRHRRFKHALAAVENVVEGLIAHRRAHPAEGEDLLTLLLAARDEDGSALSDEDLRNQSVTFLLAGHETTASLLTWALTLLATHPAERTLLEAELDAHLPDLQPGDAVPAEALPRLSRLHANLHEALRLYPTIWIAERRVLAADTLGGFAIPAGSSVIVSPYVTQRLARLWPEPHAYRPDRYVGGETPTLAGSGYFPFGGGPHACIGQHFALMEAKIILATLLRNHRVHLARPGLPAAFGGITLSPTEAVPVRLERR